MIAFAKRLFKRKEAPPFDLGKAVERCLLDLQSCTAKVVVMSPRYGDQNYQCEVIADTDRLIPWVDHHVKTVAHLHPGQNAAIHALPIWLRGADLNNTTPSHVTPQVIGLLRPWVLDLVDQKIAEVVCPTCQQIVEDITMMRLNERRDGTWSLWTSDWRCQYDHLLYREDHEIHFQRSRQSSDS